MTENPGAPSTDPLARNEALNNLWDLLRCEGERVALMGSVARIITNAHSVTWETDVNSAGVPVRRYVMRGEWKVDPEPPAHLPQAGDVVCYAEHADGEIQTIHHGAIPPGQEWIVKAVPHIDRTDGSAILLLHLAEWAHGEFINATSREVVIMRRPGR